MEKRLIDANVLSEQYQYAGYNLDMALEYTETVLTIPENPTKGDLIKALLNPRDNQIKISPDSLWVEIEIQKTGINFSCLKEWWDSPFKGNEKPERKKEEPEQDERDER